MRTSKMMNFLLFFFIAILRHFNLMMLPPSEFEALMDPDIDNALQPRVLQGNFEMDRVAHVGWKIF